MLLGQCIHISISLQRLASFSRGIPEKAPSFCFLLGDHRDFLEKSGNFTPGIECIWLFHLSILLISFNSLHHWAAWKSISLPLVHHWFFDALEDSSWGKNLFQCILMSFCYHICIGRLCSHKTSTDLVSDLLSSTLFLHNLVSKMLYVIYSNLNYFLGFSICFILYMHQIFFLNMNRQKKMCST